MLIGGDVEKAERWLGGKLKDIRAFIDDLYEHDVHAKRVDALAGATLGVMTSASLAVAMIGQALAQARGLVTKHAIKQVDRLLSNQIRAKEASPEVDVWESFAHWVPHLVGARREMVVAMDWTDFDRDGQATLALNLVTRHGRATPLLWLTVWKDELAHRRNDYEDACLVRLSQVSASRGLRSRSSPTAASATVSYSLSSVNWALATSSDGAATSTSPNAAGETRPVAEWVGKAGRARKLRDAKVTATEGYRVGAVVCVHGPGDEGTLVPGRQRPTGADRQARQPLRQTLDHRAEFS